MPVCVVSMAYAYTGNRQVVRRHNGKKAGSSMAAAARRRKIYGIREGGIIKGACIYEERRSMHGEA